MCQNVPRLCQIECQNLHAPNVAPDLNEANVELDCGPPQEGEPVGGSSTVG